MPSKVAMGVTGENAAVSLPIRRATDPVVLAAGIPLVKVAGRVLTHRLTPAGMSLNVASMRVPKSASPRNILSALRLVLSGEIYVPPLMLDLGPVAADGSAHVGSEAGERLYYTVPNLGCLLRDIV